MIAGMVAGIIAIVYVLVVLLWPWDDGPGNAPYDDNYGPF